LKAYITRFSSPSDRLQPCDEARLDENNNRWFVELHSLSALIELAEKYQTLILEVDHKLNEFRIEIFDDWSDQA